MDNKGNLVFITNFLHSYISNAHIITTWIRVPFVHNLILQTGERFGETIQEIFCDLVFMLDMNILRATISYMISRNNHDALIANVYRQFIACKICKPSDSLRTK